MKRWQYRPVLLCVAALLAACATGLPQKGSSREARLSQPDDRTTAPELKSLAEARPCAITTATPTFDGVRIWFTKEVFWTFDRPTGGIANGGVIAGGVVTRFVTLPDGRDDVLPDEPYIDLKFGHKLRLRAPHTGCTVWSTRDQARSFLHTKSSLCLPVLPCESEETAHELRG